MNILFTILACLACSIFTLLVFALVFAARNGDSDSLDSERLDFLEIKVLSLSNHDGAWAVLAGTPPRVVGHPAYSLREAIDQAEEVLRG